MRRNLVENCRLVGIQEYVEEEVFYGKKLSV
jgi:hypothetical protein